MTTVEWNTTQTQDAPSKRGGCIDRWCRASLERRMAGLREGTVRFVDGPDSRAFGSTLGGDDSLSATVYVQGPQFYSDVALGGSIGAAEAYMRGLWTCDDLTTLMRLLVRNRALLEQIEGWPGRIRLPAQKLLHAWRRNSQRGSRANIAAHYDLGNEFFRLFLDETLTYSCGVFESATSTMHEASLAKIDRICRKLQLAPHDHLLEIGTGWGSLAIYAARHYGCRVTTTTISRAQFEVACQRVEEAGLSDRVHVECQDYRNLTGRFDKLVSIEMIEAVGQEYLDEYFSVCDRLLKPEGMMALQAILIPDRQFAAYARSVDFIQRYVFPGGFLPSLGAICQSLGNTSELQVSHVEDISAHYARTLNIWRTQFFENLSAVQELGYSDEFIRMWEFYLCYCEAGFLERSCTCAQLLLVKPRCQVGSLRRGLRCFASS
jgi:cyclopropane-fatty-acyl-phospholipid synthase